MKRLFLLPLIASGFFLMSGCDDSTTDSPQADELSFEMDTLIVSQKGGQYEIAINGTRSFDFVVSDAPEGPIEPATIFSPADIDLKASLNQEQRTLKLTIQPAKNALIRGVIISIESNDKKQKASLIVLQEGDFNKMSERLEPIISGLMQIISQASEKLFTMESFYTQSVPEVFYFGMNDFYHHKPAIINNPFLHDSFTGSFQAIHAINSIIRDYEKYYSNPLFPSLLKNMRAWLYYQMGIVWGNLPYYDKVLTTNDNPLPQENRQVFFQKIETELKTTFQLYQDQGDDGSFSNSKSFTAHLLARVYCQLKQPGEAIKYLNHIIESDHYYLDSNPDAPIEANSPELIYGLELDHESAIYPKLIMETDLLPALTYTEVLLLAADCHAAIGQNDKALELMNRIRGHHHLSLATHDNFDDLLKETWKAVLKGQFSYFAFLERHDLLQTELNIEPYQELFPIPGKIAYEDPSIKQNPGW